MSEIKNMLHSCAPVLSCTDLHKSYTQGDTVLNILTGVNLQVLPGETVSIVGSSGSGKSTLLHVLAGLDTFTSGIVTITGTTLAKLNDTQMGQLRNQHLGFVYQFHHLLPEFTALENVLMPLIIAGVMGDEAHDRAYQLLKRLGLDKRLEHFPGQLSGGERQRVAIARAVINKPKLVFADEPTGNLDNYTGNQVLDIFFTLQEELQTSVIIVTHDSQIAAKAKTQYNLHNGRLQVVATLSNMSPAF